MNRIAVLGSTGSIGTSTLDVLAGQRNSMQLVAVTAQSRWQQLAEQTRQFDVPTAVVSDESLANSLDQSAFAAGCSVQFGADALVDLAASDAVDTVVAAIVGAAGLRSSWAAVDAGKRVALANKETMIVAGPLIVARAAETGAELLPVDSEHSAIFQCLAAGRREDVRRVILTASGGPFRGWSREQLDAVTPDDARKHPTWDMGERITIDSATLMNKALEVIEAKWLFGLEADQIEVVVHPQSVIHSLVEFVDGSCVAQLSPPDMKLPIQYALTYPERRECPSPKMDWSAAWSLDFEPPDRDAFPALDLGFEVARRGGTCGAVLNASKEAAVDRFLAGEVRFTDIPRICRAMLDAHNFDPAPSLSELLQLDAWARRETIKWTR
jgi:1-deoxy-D-xylulose-5-phosphate reductoisomerase